MSTKLKSLSKYALLSWGKNPTEVVIPKGNILFSSHDAELLETVANRIISFKKDGTILWNVEIHINFVSIFTSSSTLSFISLAALLVNVTARMTLI